MSPDPFEEMQRRNPVTPDEVPEAPMSVAERILGARAERTAPGWAMAAAAMIVVAVGGGGMLLWLGGGDAAPIGSGGTTSTSAASTSLPTTSVPVVDPTTTSAVASACSGTLVDGGFTEQPGLPAVVAAKRAAIREAAVECDWDRLQGLLGPTFAYSFGGQDDAIDAPIHHWRRLEEEGQDPIRFLAELLNQPFGTLDGGEGLTYYVWPSVHAKGWEEATDAEIEALRVLYDDADLAGFAEFGGYYGYRIGILSNGDWMYFLAGD